MASRVDQVPRSPYETILNFRDLGETINKLSGTTILATGKLFRSGEPDFALASDRRSLTTDHHIRTVIDLRSKTEHIEAAKKLAENPPPASAAVPQSTQDTAKPLELGKPTTHAISLTGSSFERALLWQLKWSSMGKLVYRMALGRRLEGITILGTEVMAPRGLLGLGQDTLVSSGAEVRECFEILGDPEAYPIQYHCTQGKDRTGLLTILALLLCGVDESVIESDYMASERELESQRETRVKYMATIGLGPEFAACPEGFVAGIVQFLNERWGGVEEYLQSVGVNHELRNRVKRCLLALES